MTLGEKLKKLRTDSGLTQEELAEKLFVSRTAISKWESDRGYPNIETLKIQWICWHALYRERKASVEEKALEQKIRACYQQVQVPGYRWRYARG